MAVEPATVGHDEVIAPSAADRCVAAVAFARAELDDGRAVLLINNRSGRSHLVASAGQVSIETLELMVSSGRGVLRAAMTPERMDRLGIAGLTKSPNDGRRYAPPVDEQGHERPGSLADRAATARALAAPDGEPHNLVTPGHVVPVEADSRGTLAVGQVPEAAFDLVRGSGNDGVGLYIDLADFLVTPNDIEERDVLGRRLGVGVVTLRDLIVDSELVSSAVNHVVTTKLPTVEGDLKVVGYRSKRTDADCIAFLCGDATQPGLPVYIHSRCPVSDVFGGLACGCGEQLEQALSDIRRSGDGLVLYSSWGPANQLGHLIPAPEPPDYPGRVVRASREREIASVLRDLGAGSVRISSNDPLDLPLLEALGVRVLSGN